MNNFLSLVGFEYKKIIKRKSFVFAMIILVLMCTLCIVGPTLFGTVSGNGLMQTQLENMGLQQKASHNVAGYLDDTMINEVIEKNAAAAKTIIDGERYPQDIFEENILPYSGLRWGMIFVFSPIKGEYTPFGSLTSGEGIDFYATRTTGIEERLIEMGCSQEEIEATLVKNSKLSEPFYFDFFNGYSVFLNMMATSIVFVVFALAMCIAPIFSEEYQKKTDSIILSSKYGKNKLIIAKITAVITFSILFILVALGIALATLFSVYPTFGGNVSIQLWEIFTVYPLTMLKALLIYCGVILCAALLVAAICTFLSSYFSSFATIITTLLLLFGGMFVSIDIESLRTLNYFLPAKMLNSGYVFSQRLVNVFGLYIEPYIFIPILCFIFIAVFLSLGYRGFKNHQQ